MSTTEDTERTVGTVMSGLGGAAEKIGGTMGGVAGGIIAGIGALVDLGGIILQATGGGSVALVAMRDEAKAFADADVAFSEWLSTRLVGSVSKRAPK